MSLNELAREIHETAEEKGWWETRRELPELIALAHSELSEALESWRNGEQALNSQAAAKPDGWGVELIDCLIRILDTCAYFCLDVDGLLSLKMEYNKHRPYRHGGKLA